MTDVIELNVALDDIASYELLPEGTYPATTLEPKDGVDKNGDPYWMQSVLIDPEHYPIDYDRDNAPEGTIVPLPGLIYKPVPNEEGHFDRRRIDDVKGHQQKLGLPLNVKVIDPTLWIGKAVMVTITHSVDSRNDKPIHRAVRYEAAL